jgi:hypothetical protein
MGDLSNLNREKLAAPVKEIEVKILLILKTNDMYDILP